MMSALKLISEVYQQDPRSQHHHLNKPKYSACHNYSPLAYLLLMVYQRFKFKRKYPVLHREKQVVIIDAEKDNKENPICGD